MLMPHCFPLETVLHAVPPQLRPSCGYPLTLCKRQNPNSILTEGLVYSARIYFWDMNSCCFPLVLTVPTTVGAHPRTSAQLACHLL